MKNEETENNSMFKSLFVDNFSIMLLIDPDTGKIIEANKSACQFYGYSYKQFTNMNISDINIYAEKKVKKNMFEAKLSQKNHFIFRHKLNSGKIKDVEVFSNIINYKNQNVLFSIIHDITKLKEQQIENQKTNFRLNKAEVIAHIGNWEFDLEKNTVKASTGAKKIYGLNTDDNFLTIPFIQSIPLKEYRKKLDKALTDLIAHKKKYDLEFKIKRKNDGQIRFIHSVAKYLKEENTVFGIIRDITEEKKAEKKIRKLSTAVEQSSNAILITDSEGNIEYVNKKFTELTGYSEEEIIGQNPQILKSETQQKKFYSHLCNTIYTGHVWKGEFYNKTKNGSLYWEQATISPIIDEKGIITNFLAIKEDISLRKKTEEKLKKQNEEYYALNEEYKTTNEELIIAKNKAQESENRFSELFRNMSNGCAIYKVIDNGKDFIFLDFNKASEKIEKLKKEDIIGKSVSEIFPAAKEIGILEAFSRVYKTGIAEHFPVTFYKDNRLEGWRENYIYKLSNGNIVAVYDDRTIEKNAELKLKQQNEEYATLNEEYKIQNEELLIAKNKAQESDKLKTEFIHNLSHEIRTPMNGILGFSELLASPNLPEEKRKQYINIIQNSGKQLMRIIDDILEISKLETKQIKIIEQEICLNDLLLEQFSVFDIKAKEKKIPLYLKNGLSDDDSLIFIDKSKLTKILSNLIENAIKYTEKGFVEFGYKLINKQKNKFIQLYVKDTGVGIKKENQKLIFNRFSQEEKELSLSLGGLGLGLSIAKENTELLGGNISLLSEKGKGSTFFVSIPYKTAKTNILNQKKELLKKQNNHTVLIVEDEEVNFLFIDTLLGNLQSNIKTLHARHGKEAVKICKENSEIDFVFMDLKMPVMNGFDAIKIIKKFRPNLPIIAQTAYTSKEDKKKAFIAGCDDFISKPIDKNTLNSIINKYIFTN